MKVTTAFILLSWEGKVGTKIFSMSKQMSECEHIRDEKQLNMDGFSDFICLKEKACQK